MQRIDWMARTVESEVAYSVARGGVREGIDHQTSQRCLMLRQGLGRVG